MAAKIESKHIPHPHSPSTSLHIVTLTPSSSEDALTQTPILFVHGLGSSSSFWLGSLQTADGNKLIEGRTIWLIDAYGHGRSGRAEGEDGVEEFARGLEGVVEVLLREVGKEKLILVGHSMSGLVTSIVTGNRPDLIEKLFLLSPTLIFPSPTKQNLSNRADQVSLGLTTHSTIAQTVGTTGISSQTLSSNPMAAAFIRHLVLSTDPTNYAVACRALAASKEEMWAPEKIQCPFFILHGEEDYMIKEESIKGWVEAVGKAQGGKASYGVMKGVGHWGAVEVPEVVARGLVNFILG